MKASEYKVTFPYGATTTPYSPSHPHSGEDRKMPIGTPVDVGDAIIGLSGNTGKSTGPHLHIQKYKGGYQNPQGKGLANTIAFPAVVSEVGENSEIGKYIRLMDKSLIRWSYFHLSRVGVVKGSIINTGGDMHDGKTAKEWYEEANRWHVKADEYLKLAQSLQKKADAFEVDAEYWHAKAVELQKLVDAGAGAYVPIEGPVYKKKA